MKIKCECGSYALNDDPNKELCDICWRDRKDWEWIECPQCHGAWLETAHPAILKSCGCKGGKVLHQAARYLDEQEGK